MNTPKTSDRKTTKLPAIEPRDVTLALERGHPEPLYGARQSTEVEPPDSRRPTGTQPTQPTCVAAWLLGSVAPPPDQPVRRTSHVVTTTDTSKTNLSGLRL